MFASSLRAGMHTEISGPALEGVVVGVVVGVGVVKQRRFTTVITAASSVMQNAAMESTSSNVTMRGPPPAGRQCSRAGP